MSFLLIFGSLWRNPLRTIFTFLSISTAFLLFGYLASIDAAFRGGVDAAGADRLVVLHKQSLINLLPESYIHKIKSIPEKNNDEIITAAKTIPRISTVLTKLTEYYSDTTYIVPKDINPIG